MERKAFLTLLDKYLSGKASEQEEQFLMDVYQRMEDQYEWTDAEMKALDQMENRLIARFQNSINEQKYLDSAPRLSKPSVFKRNRFLSAAAIILVFLFAGIIYRMMETSVSQSLFLGKAEHLSTYKNKSGKEQRLIFADKSFVELKSGSSIVYDKYFTGAYRQVYIQGEGYFHIAKDHSKPFIVFTDRVVAKVLGTSFIVKSSANGESSSILVKTGKVSVFKTKEFTEANAKPTLEDGIVLLPNHEALVDKEEKLAKRIAVRPDLLKMSTKNLFDFDNTPVDSVFSILQANYGIAIQYDKDKFKSCSITVDMGKEDFYKKIELVCRTINATYQVRDGNVYVAGPGCN